MGRCRAAVAAVATTVSKRVSPATLTRAMPWLRSSAAEASFWVKMCENRVRIFRKKPPPPENRAKNVRACYAVYASLGAQDFTAPGHLT